MCGVWMVGWLLLAGEKKNVVGRSSGFRGAGGYESGLRIPVVVFELEGHWFLQIKPGNR